MLELISLNPSSFVTSLSSLLWESGKRPHRSHKSAGQSETVKQGVIEVKLGKTEIKSVRLRVNKSFNTQPGDGHNFSTVFFLKRH